MPRTMALRGILGLMAALAGWLLVSASVRAADATVSDFNLAGLYGITPMSDGSVWADEYPSGRIVRVDETGARTPLRLPPHVSVLTFDVLPDGSVGMLVRQRRRGRRPRVSLVRIDSSTATTSPIVTLPPEIARATALALAPDGAVWFTPPTCGDVVFRYDVGTRRTARVQLRHRSCGFDEQNPAPEKGSALTVGPDGAVWLVNAYQGRVARISVRRRVREWHMTPQLCDCSYAAIPSSAFVKAGPHGGIVWKDGDGGAGRITPAGKLAGFGDGFEPTRTRDGAVVSAGGTYVGKTPSVRSSPNSIAYYTDPHLVVTAADGTATSIPMPAFQSDRPAYFTGASTVLVPDGSLWVQLGGLVLDPDAYEPIVSVLRRPVRVVLPNVTAPRPPVAHLRRVLGRFDSTAWVQLSCDAERARFCVGTARIGSGEARFTIAGASDGAVPLRLPNAMVEKLRRRRAVRLDLQISTRGGDDSHETVRLTR